MSDESHRELERRFRTSAGSVEDEAAWLRARLQAGELSEERLGLAAYLGHHAARLVLGQAVQESEEIFLSAKAVDTLFSSIMRQGGEAASRRASVAVCELIEEHPCDLLEEPGPHIAHRFNHAYSWFHKQEHCELASRVRAQLPEQAATYPDADEQTQETILTEARKVATQVIRRQIADFVVPWALGTGDPALPGLAEFED